MKTSMTLVGLIAVGFIGAPSPIRETAEQTGLEVLGGLGELIGSVFQRKAYVGSMALDLFRLRSKPARLELNGFSLLPPSGGEWFVAQPYLQPANVIQAVWFVKDPHRFTVWAKKGRIPARTQVASVSLRFYGVSEHDIDWRRQVENFKRAELVAESLTVLTLETTTPASDRDCVRYTARADDRRRPPGFDEIPFVLTLAGLVCPHPSAQGLVVDAGYSWRALQGEPTPMPTPDSALGEFVQAVTLTQLRPRSLTTCSCWVTLCIESPSWLTQRSALAPCGSLIPPARHYRWIRV